VSEPRMPRWDYFQTMNVGSLQYLAPEQCSGLEEDESVRSAVDTDADAEPYQGRKLDSWACGVILFAMLLGRLPLAVRRFCFAVCRATPVPSRESPVVSNVVLWCLPAPVHFRSMSRVFVLTFWHCQGCRSIPSIIRTVRSGTMIPADAGLSEGALNLLRGLLHPDPKRRPLVSRALHHSWITSA
jgi:serine/threonine protein kinase